MMLFYNIFPTGNIIWLPFLSLLAFVTSLGVGLWLSALNVQFRDVRYIVPFLVQFWMFATPVIYPSSLVPERWRWVLALNPLTSIIEGYRAALFGRQFDWTGLSISAGIILVLLFYAMYSFRRMEKSFADII